MKNIGLIILTIISYQFSLAQEILSLDRAIALTLENNYDIKISKNTEQIAKNNSGILNSGYLPVSPLTASCALAMVSP